MKFHFRDNEGVSIKFIFEDKADAKSIYFEGKEGEIFPIESENKILVGLGKQEKFNLDKLVSAAYTLGRFIGKRDIKSLKINNDTLDKIDNKKYFFSVVEGLYLSSYNFDHYKSEKDNFNLENVSFNVPDLDNDETKEELDELIKVLEGQYLARNLVNLRSNDIYPETLAEEAKKNLSDLGVKVKVFDKEEIEKIGLKSFLEVSKGSAKEPKFIVMEYLNGNDEKPLVFVGKGLTYDSGGYSVKPTSGMSTMNSDMGGSGTVIGAMKAIASNGLKVNVVGIVAACENMISGDAYKPGDVIGSLSGKTIEVDNTDAEGRLTLADAVYYGADKYNPAVLIDLATLTGAALVALGERYTAVVTNSDRAFEALQVAADEAREKIWKMPNDPDFKELYKSDVADFKNSGGRFAGTITAGQFVGEFVKDVDWIHMDIAGTAYYSANFGNYPKGATGVHVKTLYNFAKNYSKES